MGSKSILLLALMLAVVLLISSQVAARDLAETENTVNASKESDDEKSITTDQYGGGYPGGGYNRGGGYPGGGYPGGGYNRGGYRRGYCRYGCCGRNYYRGGCYCCRYAGQQVDDQIHN